VEKSFHNFFCIIFVPTYIHEEVIYCNIATYNFMDYFVTEGNEIRELYPERSRGGGGYTHQTLVSASLDEQFKHEGNI